MTGVTADITADGISTASTVDIMATIPPDITASMAITDITRTVCCWQTYP